MSDKPALISVITVAYNEETTIEKTILSVVTQNYSPIEYIIIDGGSTDGTVDIIRKYESHITYWISEKDEGIYDAMNKGLKYASGEWSIFMNSGDWFYDETVIEKVFSDKYSSAIGIIYGAVEFRFANEEVIQQPYSLPHILKGMAFSHQSAFVRTSLLKQSPYNLHFRIVADYEFFLREYRLGVGFQYVPEVIASFDKLTGISASPSYKNYKKHLKELIELEKIYNTETNYGLFYYLLCFRFLLKNAILKIVPSKIWYRILKRRIKLNK